MKTLYLAVIFCLAAFSLAHAVPETCDPSNDFVGTVIVDALTGPLVQLEWTSFETPDIQTYRLIRMPAPATTPSSSTRRSLIAELEPEQPWTERRFQVTDSAPAGNWIYRLLVRRHHARPCTLETEPLTVPEHPPCGAIDVCNQVAQSLGGTVIVDAVVGPTVQLEWGSCAEDASVLGYRVSRARADRSGSHCWRRRAFIRADGGCGDIQLHRLTDEPRAGEYVYRLQVLDERGRPVCSVELPVSVR